MARLLRNLLLVLLVAGGSRVAVAFSLLGPSPAVGAANPALNWQNPGFNIGYNPFNVDIGGPLNLGEEYRWNVPVITYAFDESFENYFGSNGVAAVEAAITILNNLTNVSKFSANLTEFPLNTTRHNFQAQALNLLDLKSMTLHLLLEEMGLAQAERYVWTLRQRTIINIIGGGQTTNYFVTQRNFDPVTLTPSSYINGTLYTYTVLEFDPVNFPPFADAVETPAQIPPTSINSSVSAGAPPVGGFFTGLTRDDAGGLRYLYRPDNMNVEDVLGDIQVAVTNTTTLTLLTNSDLATFTTRTVNTTNDPARLINLYPGLLITTTNAFLTNQFLTNITTFFTNFPVAATPVYVTNITPVIVTNFNYTFGNVVTNTNSIFSNNTVIFRTVSVNLAPGFTPGLGTLVTNIVTNSIVLSNYPNGEFYVRPTNLLDFQIASTQLVQVVAATNVISSTFGNLFAFTNTATMVPVATGDLTLLAERSYGTTLTPAQITNLYPGILITRTNNRVTNALFTNFVGTNVVITNGLAAVFDYTYGNVLTNVAVTNPTVRTQIVEIVASTNVGPGGTTFQTNLLVSGLTTSNFLSGEFTIVPTNLLGYSIVADLFTNVTEVTNIIFTNANAVFTNTGAPVDVFGFDLSDFIFLTQNTTNPPARLQALFPGLFITGTNAFLTNVQTTNITTIFPGFPATNIPTLLTTFPTNIWPAPVLVTNFTSVLLTNFNYTFGNVTTNFTTTNNAFLRQDLIITQAAGVTPGQGAFVTNITSTTGTTNYLNGEIIIRPTNLFGYSLINTQILSVLTNTNVLSLSYGNLLAYTNDAALEPLITGDLTVLTEASYGTTNTAATITNLFPGIVITHTNIRVTNVFITNFVGNAALVTNTIGTVFDYTYGNVVTNVFTNRTWVTNRMVEVFVTTNVVGPGGPVFITNVLTGDIVAAGGSATNPAAALITPLGFNNDLLLVAATNGTVLNGVPIRFIDDHTTVTSNAAVAAFDAQSKAVTIAIRTNVTDAGAVVRAINALSLPEGLTAGGETNKAGAAVTPFGANNDLLIQALATNVMTTNAVTNIFTNFVFGGGISLVTNIVTNVVAVSNFNGVTLRLLDDGSVTGNAATSTYDTAGRVLTVRMQKAATTAATIVGAVATSGAAGMAAFRADYAVTLNAATEPGNTGLGTLGVPLFIASLSAATAPDNVAGIRVNDGTGTLGANVGVATLETNLTRGQPFASGEFYIVPTNAVVANNFTNTTVGYDIRLPIVTNISTNVTLVITNATAVFTNTSVGTNIVTVDLAQFAEVAASNSPAQLVAAFNTAFPGQPPLLITGTNTFFTNLVTATVTNILVTSPYQSPLEPPLVVLVTNFTTNVVQRFAYTFGNVVTNPSPAATNGIIALVNQEFIKDPYAPAFTTNLLTNVTTTLVTSNFLNGYVYIVPTNLFGYSIISTQLVTVTNFTNNIFSFVITNSGNQVTNTLDLVQFVTNYYLNVNPIEFVNPTNVGVVGPGIRQEVVRFGTNTVYGVYPIIVATVPPQFSDGFTFTISGEGTRIELLTYSTNFIHRAYPVEFVNPTNVTGPGIRSEWVRFVTNTFKAAFPIELLAVPGSLGGGIGTNVEMITFATNSVLAVNPIVWQSAAATPPILRRGVDKITFQRVQFDSLLGQGFLSVTNTYSDTVVTNSTNAAQFIRRINTRPDILFRAEDLGFFVALGGPITALRTVASGWINNNALNGQTPGGGDLPGPGVINPQVQIDFNKVGTTLLNTAPFFVTQPNGASSFVWGSFDGSTNAPIVYPLGSSITNLEQQVLTNTPPGP